MIWITFSNTLVSCNGREKLKKHTYESGGL